MLGQRYLEKRHHILTYLAQKVETSNAEGGFDDQSCLLREIKSYCNEL